MKRSMQQNNFKYIYFFMWECQSLSKPKRRIIFLSTLILRFCHLKMKELPIPWLLTTIDSVILSKNQLGTEKNVSKASQVLSTSLKGNKK